jgi:protein-tyrosine-phosphatase/DNA-binding transcriptional ArsR family regulator
MMRAFSGRPPDASKSGAIDSSDALELLTALAHPSRLETFRLLIRYLPYGLAAGDIARLIALPHNTLSPHLAILEQAGLARSRREGRSIIFVAVSGRAQRLAAFLKEECCPAAGVGCAPFGSANSDPFPARREVSAANKVYNVLVLCTGNSVRSIMAEAILNREGQGRFRAFSAGSRPGGEPDPRGLALLACLGYDIRGVRSKSWREFAGPEAPIMDFILTVCDSAAGEACPRWPGQPVVAHWGISDPAAIIGAEAEKRSAFMDAYRRLTARISSLVNLDIDQLDLPALRRTLGAIGRMDGATDMALQRAIA